MGSYWIGKHLELEKKRKQNLTPEQLSEISRKAGIASGRARRAKKSPNT